MAKAAPYRLTWIPEQKIYALHDNFRELVLSMAPENQEWFALLANIPSFTFSGQHGQLTVRREPRSSGRVYWYWTEPIKPKKHKKKLPQKSKNKKKKKKNQKKNR